MAGDDRDGLGDLVDRIAAEEGLSGVIRVDLDGSLAVQRAYGLAHRGLGVPTTVDTQFSISSGSKGLTAGSTPRLRTSTHCGTPCSTGGSSLRTPSPR